MFFFFFSSRRRHTRSYGDWSSDVCSSDLLSAIIAAEAMRRLPRLQSYGSYPQNTRLGDFRISSDGDLGELVASDAFQYTSSTGAKPRDPAALQRVAGHGSSPTVEYHGEGIY